MSKLKILKLRKRQKGAVLIIFVFMIALVLTAYLLKQYDSVALNAEQDRKTMQTLNKAKEALIAWSVSHSKKPGQMPFPDTIADGNYDGNSNCNSSSSTFTYDILLGQLPILGQTDPCIAPQVGVAEDFKDASGNRLWYAVSRNLTHIYENFPVTSLRDPVINPDILNNPLVNPDSNQYPLVKDEVRNYPWLKVLDANGNLVSNRVAAVIIAPGNVIGTQSRTGAAPNANQFLDSFKIGNATYSNANYLTPDQAFVMGQDSRFVGPNDTRFVKPYYFNDKLIYITVDELMIALNNRAASEASRVLNQYKNKTNQYPYAAKLDATQENHVSTNLAQKGLVPIDGTDICECESELKCTCSFKAINKVTFTRGSGTWSKTTLECTRYSSNCNCTGAGSCENSSGSEFFKCDAFGNCEHNLSGSNSFKYEVPDYANIRRPIADQCAEPVNKTILCNGKGQFYIGLAVDPWFKDNLWQDFLYFEWTNYQLQLGNHGNLNAILIAMGQPIANELGINQTRPSLNITDYLDSIENINNDFRFEASTKLKSTNYNDQPFIVAP